MNRENRISNFNLKMFPEAGLSGILKSNDNKEREDQFSEK